MNKLGIFMNFWEKQWQADYRRYIDKVSRIGFDILEFQAQPLLDIDDKELKAIRRYADEKNVKLSYSLGLNMRYDISSADEATRRAGVQYLKDIVRKIAVQGDELFSGVTFAGRGVPKEFVDEAKKRALFDRSVASMREVMTVAEGEGVTICVEAVNRFESPLINTAKEAVAYVQTVDSPNVGVHLDTYHMNIEEDSIEDAIRYAAKYLRHFHTGENNRNVPGRGHLDWEGIFRTLAEIGYKGDIVSEPFLMMGDEVGYDIRVWRPILDNPTEARLDSEAAFLLEFTRTMLRRYER